MFICERMCTQPQPGAACKTFNESQNANNLNLRNKTRRNNGSRKKEQMLDHNNKNLKETALEENGLQGLPAVRLCFLNLFPVNNLHMRIIHNH